MKIAWRVGSVLVIVLLTVWTVSAQTTVASGQVRGRVAAKKFFLYVGSFTRAAPNGHPDGGVASKGIYVARFDAETGVMGMPVLAAEVENPTFLAVSPDERFLYATTESGPESFVSAYAIDAHTGGLRALNRLPTGGSGTAYLSLDRTGRDVLFANYGSASVSVIQVEADGSLGKLTSFVQHVGPRSVGGAAAAVPHPHATVASPDNRFVVVPDLGLDKLFVYPFDAGTGVLGLPATVVELPPDEGPRHFVFSPDGMFGYLITQAWGKVYAYRWDGRVGRLSLLGTAASFPAGLDATNMSAEIGITPNGKFVYASHRRTHDGGRALGPDSIVAFRVDGESGGLTEVQDVDLGGSIPRCFSIDPSGSYVAVGGQQTNRVALYRIDAELGTLSKTAAGLSIHTPACMVFVGAR